MKVILAGYNYDINYGKRIKTPETLSASYARISRSEKSIEKIREESCKDIVKTRKSNKTIIFGLGHSSVAEHAVFNFDIINISRLATEYVQHHRLASYTEKSQRYVNFRNSYHIPKEIKNNIKLLKEYKNFCNKTFSLYKEMINKFKIHDIDKNSINEDARYILPLSTYTQFGMTVNGRSIEHMIASLNSQNIDELAKLSKALYNNSHALAPSIIKYTTKRDLLKREYKNPKHFYNKQVKLLYQTSNQLNEILTNILFSRFGYSYNEAKKLSNKKEYENEIIKIFSQMKMWDKPPREFETIKLTFLLSLSASAFAQLKRHRIATILPQGYNYTLDPIVPETIKNIGYEKKYMKIFKESQKISNKLAQINQSIMHYTALNGTQRNVLFTINARELYHFIRLRADEHAQWEIRQIAENIVKIVKKDNPLIYKILSGKDKFS